MKTTNIIQRLCLFLFVLVLAAPAWATDYGRLDYETFRSRNTVNAVGKKKPVSTLRQGRVEINFSDCRTTSGTDNSAIYELAKGSHFSVKVDEGYAVRWIILRDTEGGKDYDEREGIWRIDRVPHYAYFFEKTAISNAHISGGNKDNLNDDNNNIVVYNYSAPERVVNIYTHNNKDWGQFKVRDIIVGYVKVPKVKFERDRYDVYTVSGGFYANLDKDEYDGKVEYKVANYEDVVKLYGDGSLKLLHPGTEVLTAIFPANEKFAGASCSTTINVKRDRVTFNYQIERPKVLYYEGEGYAHEVHNLYDYSDFTTESGIPYKRGNDGFNVECTNDNVLRPDAMSGKCFFERTAGTVDVTINQRKNDLYEESSLKQTFTVIRTDKGAHTMLIKDLNEWKVFAHLVNDEGMTNLNAKLEADVNLGSEINMVGNVSSKDYSGTFDGQNHTLTLNWNANTNDIAPFRRVKNATIKNLRTEGTIKSSSYFLGGLIDEATGGSNTVANCVSAVNITSSYASNRCGAGGLISYIYTNTQVTITDCLVKGSINGTGAGRTGMGGFVCYQYGTCTLNTCLYAGTNNGSNEYSYTIAPNATLNNCYYLNACGSEYKQGTKVTEEQLRSGEVAYKLQNGRNNTVWGQMLGTNDEPLLTDDGAKRVYKVDFTFNSQVRATRYATRNKAIYGSMPTFTPKDLLGSDYNEHHYYSGIAFEDGFNGSTTVTSDKQVRINLAEKDCYEIASKENWKAFCDIVNSGQNKIDAKLMRNVDLGSEINMVGNDSKEYGGTFDGQGYTLKLNWDSGSNGYIAPFSVVEGATIKNLRTEGQITSNEKFLSGLLMSAYGTITLTNCVSNVNITSSILISACNAAGMIYFVKPGANVTIDDCVVKGNITATTDIGKDKMAGFVGSQEGTCTLNNCLYLGSGNGDTFSRTFVGDAYYGATTTLNNCYYLNTCGKAQGTKITAEQLKSGEVTKKLQADRTDKCYWAQQLGEMPDFYNAADKSKANYVYYDAAKNGWACDDFRLTDGQPLPIGLDFTAATVTYERNFNGTQNATLCLPYDLYAQGFKAYTLSGGNKNEVHFKEVDDKLTAYTPYYITANGMPQLGGTNIEVKAYTGANLTTSANGYSIKGTVVSMDNATAAAANAYILQDDGMFHKVTTDNPGATVPAYHAYIICPPQASGAKQLSVVLDGETTGIGDVTNEATDGKNGPVYDLQGRRVADRLDGATRHSLPAGVYIVGGRKVVVK
ncbi:peptidase M26 [Prevotella intermedia]|uniref:Peptidase M26 n=1 Tax=Prevotella intermedia TaxID=28131 RepID=A0A2M8M4B8_PREIN|nr:peptidase M26 [Prevotella intermedia]PJE99040.1 peptidase M26 [Prevotella intermedia]